MGIYRISIDGARVGTEGEGEGGGTMVSHRTAPCRIVPWQGAAARRVARAGAVPGNPDTAP
ncbi:hypothetical protein SAMN05428939_0328 [Streptomyces sp. TLI_105]|nr:hypothetical protein SAMN05428939_0328 [Streptomyces sp. TLI_105]